MFAFALPALKFLRGNWTWALPMLGMFANASICATRRLCVPKT
jgi:hypothetical protein